MKKGTKIGIIFGLLLLVSIIIFSPVITKQVSQSQSFKEQRLSRVQEKEKVYRAQIAQAQNQQKIQSLSVRNAKQVCENIKKNSQEIITKLNSDKDQHIKLNTILETLVNLSERLEENGLDTQKLNLYIFDYSESITTLSDHENPVIKQLNSLIEHCELKYPLDNNFYINLDKVKQAIEELNIRNKEDRDFLQNILVKIRLEISSLHVNLLSNNYQTSL